MTTNEWTFKGSALTVDGKYKAWDISGFWDLPPLRGDNITIPFVSGETWVQKYTAARTVTLALVVLGTSHADTVTNINTLLSLFAAGTTQGTLSYIGDGGTKTALAEVKPPISLTWKSNTAVMGAVDFIISGGTFT